ncbi:MAG: RecQ family ATP-dependent DNA helicase, partial [Pseudobdellovibrionaceae bacterium]|nr:RecQ family ATP-dependent DNA helicase [Pseudobdellovibrionaceae bacterium]
MDGGFVYVMSTPSMPGIFKIGQTTNITKRRAQLSSSTATPMPFNCDYKVFTPQHVEFEKALHKELEPFRVNDSKEFFQCPLEIIKHAFQVAHYKRFGTLCPAPDTIPETDPDTAWQPSETATMRTAPQPAPRNPSPLTGDQITAALATYFGFSTFRPGQLQIMEQLLAGQSSAAVFPTGSGKSLCYQLPGLLLPGLTLVISPLIALMKDQIDALLAKGIQAARLDSTLTNNEYQEVMRGVRGGRIKILYVAPERFMNERFRSAMQGIRISLFAVDEAHCVSEWGHNFRPDYLKLSLFARSFGAECILALTATATPEVLKDICRSFDIETVHAVCTGFYRPNLTLLTKPIENSRRDDQL